MAREKCANCKVEWVIGAEGLRFVTLEGEPWLCQRCLARQLGIAMLCGNKNFLRKRRNRMSEFIFGPMSFDDLIAPFMEYRRKMYEEKGIVIPMDEVDKARAEWEAARNLKGIVTNA